MNQNRSFDDAVRQGIDVCRPGHDDLRDAELAHVAQAVVEDAEVASHFGRVQRCDVRMQAAMHDVTIPENLAGRLLAGLRATQLNAVAGEAAVSPNEVAISERTASSVKWRWSMALAASLLIAATVIAYQKWRPAEAVDIATLADVWQGQLAAQWQPMSKAPESLAIPTRLPLTPRGWQSTSNYLGYRAVAYDISRPGVRAVLFVVSVSPDGKLPNAPPRAPQFSSGGQAVAAWIAGKQMCMLVVEGDERAYRSLLGSERVPLA